MSEIVNEKKQALGEKIYIFALILGISGSLLESTMFSWAPHAINLTRIGIVLCFVKSIFIDRYTPKQFLAYVVCLGAAILSYDSARHDMLLAIPFIFAAKDVDFKKIIKIYFAVILILVLTVNISSLLGKIPNLIFSRGGKPRISYGFTYPTIEAAHIFYFILAYAVYKKFKFNWIQDIVVVFLGYFIISKGDARLDGYLTFAILFISVFRKLFLKLFDKLNSFIPALLVFILIIGHIVMAKYYNPMDPIQYNLNTLLSNRLALVQQGLMQYPLKLFGNHVQMRGFTGYVGLMMTKTSWLAKNYFYIDSSFAQILLINGVVLFIITLAVFVYLTWKNMKLRNYSFVLAIIFITISGLIESFTMQLSYDIFIVMVLANNNFWIAERNIE